MRKNLVKTIRVAEHFGVSRDTVRSWTLQGCPHIDVRVPGTKIAQLRYDLDEVIAWLEEEDLERWEREHQGLVDKVDAQIGGKE